MATQQRQPMHWRQVHRRLNEHLLFAEDLGPVGTKVDVEVIDSGIEKVKGEDGTKDMPWVAFRGKKKKLALNVGNSKALETVTGTPDIYSWRGFVTLVVVRTKYFDQKTKAMMDTDAIRIAPERPRGSKPAGARTESTDRDVKPANMSPEQPPADLSDEDKRAIEMAEAEEARRG